MVARKKKEEPTLFSVQELQERVVALDRELLGIQERLARVEEILARYTEKIAALHPCLPT